MEVHEQMLAVLKRQESYRRFCYQDTQGNWTIGYGLNISPGGLGISEEQADSLLRDRICEIEEELGRYDWYCALDEVRRSVLVNMAYNMDVTGLLGFKRMIGRLKDGDYLGAAQEMRDSLWATQVKMRAETLAYVMEVGSYDTSADTRGVD